MNTKPEVLNNLADLLVKLDHLKEFGKTLWFRGHSNSEWKLVPTIFRRPYNVSHEQVLYERFVQNSHQFLDLIPQNDWDWLFLMQHHGLPTRLLDWSESPLVGLYFCIEQHDEGDQDGAFWVLNPTIQNTKIAHFSSNTFGQIPFFHEQSSSQLSNYSPTRLRQENTTNLPPISGIAVRHSKRMQAQQAVFSIFHRDEKALDDYAEADVYLTKYLVPKENKKKIAKELDHLFINRLSIFPDLDSVAHVARMAVIK